MSTSPQQNTDTSPSSQNAKSANKRRRVALACSSCRERKVRCDGSTPVCGSCRARGVNSHKCEYLAIADTAKNQTERAYVQSLQQHIIDLERSTVPQSTEQEESQDEMRRKVMNSGPSNERQSLSALHPANSSMVADDVHNIVDLPVSKSPMGGTIGFHANSVNAMGAAITDLDNPGMGDQFYGEPSIVSLLQRSSHSVPPRTPSQRRRSVQRATKSTPSSSSWSTPSTLLGTSSCYLDDFSLPPRKVADSLLEIYFNSVHVLYPWVHRETFIISYEALWSSQDHDDIYDLPDVGIGGLDCSAVILHCSLNAMLALGSEFSHMAPEEKRAFSYLFFSRMKNLVNIDVLDSGSLAHVQALLLVGMYLQCTRDPKRCWNVIGMAYRMSVGLGLHLSRSMPGLTRLEREMRWRIWCACVQMDIIISMTMGRPAMTSPSPDIPLPSPLSDSCLANSDPENSQPRGTNSTNQFLYENMRLIALLERILSNVYHSSSAKSQVISPGSTSQEIQAIMDIESALEKFELDVHADLHWVTSTQEPEVNTNPTLKRQTNILHARFLHLRLLLYRPAFSDFCASVKSNTSRSAQFRDPRALDSSWSRLFATNCAKKCIRSACDLIESLWRATSQDATGAWWYGVFYLVSAGIILILAEMSEICFDEPEKSQRAVAWVRCTDTLQRMIDVHPCARDYKIALEGLRERHASQEAGGTDEQHGRNGPGEAHDALSPLFWNWESGLEDIMLPAQLLQAADDELFIPTLF